MNQTEVKNLCERAVSSDSLAAIYHEFHKNPEISGHEFGTMERIASYLNAWGVPYEKGIAKTGIVAHLSGKRPGKTIGLRADIDALPIEEMNTDLPFCSQNPGAMHACGHDVHTTILLGVVKVLASLDGDFSGNFTFLFQPDEEDTGGAKPMIEAGCLENPHVDHVIGLHVSPAYPVGTIGVAYGKMYAASDMFTLKVYGKSAHGAHPSDGIDAIMITANILNTLQTVVSRNTDPTDSAVCTIGKIRGGSVRNQIADYVECDGIMRTLTKESRLATRNRVEKICTMVAEAMGGRAELLVTESYNSLITDYAVTDVAAAVAREQLGSDHVVIEEKPQMGVEDFAYFAEARPSTFYHLGCVNPEKMDEAVPLHNSRFHVDERCIFEGVCLQTGMALKLAEDENNGQ